MPTTRPPLTDRAKTVIAVTRAVLRGEQKVAAMNRKLADLETDLAARRRALLDLMTSGADGANKGELE